jgi:hypothetical protein
MDPESGKIVKAFRGVVLSLETQYVAAVVGVAEWRL